MPLYDFFCPQCQQTFEELASPTESLPCPHCGHAAERRLSAPSPLGTNPFPYKAGPVHPMAQKMAAGGGACGAGGCGQGGFS